MGNGTNQASSDKRICIICGSTHTVNEYFLHLMEEQLKMIRDMMEQLVGIGETLVAVNESLSSIEDIEDTKDIEGNGNKPNKIADIVASHTPPSQQTIYDKKQDKETRAVIDSAKTKNLTPKQSVALRELMALIDEDETTLDLDADAGADTGADADADNENESSEKPSLQATSEDAAKTATKATKVDETPM